MFVLRSAFWLTVAFMVVAPASGQFGSSTGKLNAQAVAAGQEFVAAQLENVRCETIECVGGKAILSATLAGSTPSVSIPMQDATSTVRAPVPMPRLQRAG